MRFFNGVSSGVSWIWCCCGFCVIWKCEGFQFCVVLCSGCGDVWRSGRVYVVTAFLELGRLSSRRFSEVLGGS